MRNIAELCKTEIKSEGDNVRYNVARKKKKKYECAARHSGTKRRNGMATEECETAREDTKHMR